MKYGAFIQCTGANAVVAIVGVYRLYPEASITRVVDDCIGHEVPSVDEDFGDPNGLSANPDPAKTCCDPTDHDIMDVAFSFDFTCNMIHPNETAGTALVGMNPFAFETFGGCRDTTVAAYGSIPECDPGTGVTQVHFYHDWSGTEECKELA